MAKKQKKSSDPILEQLKAMKKEELVKMAGEFNPPVKLKPIFNTLQIAFHIRRRQIADNPEQAAATPAADQKAVEVIPASNPELENLLKADPAAVEEAKVDGRGGARPGAGRPLGMTNDLAAVRQLPTLPNEAVVAAIKMGFVGLAFKTGIKEVVPTDAKIEQVALPYSQLLEYHFPDKVPQIAGVYMMAIFHTFNLATETIQIIKAANELKKTQAAAAPKVENAA